MKRQFSAGGAVYKQDGGEVKWLLIKPKPSTQFPSERCQLPKGLIDPGETPEEAAVREVQEETGVNAKIISKIAYSKYVYTLDGEKIFKVVTYFLMEYLSGEIVPDKNEVEEVFWLPFEEAKKKLTYSNDKSLLQKAVSLLK